MNQILLKKLSRLKGKKIAVIGDIILDRYVFGDVSRISPEAPVPIVKVMNEEYKLGAAANVAKNLKKMENTPFLIGLTGDDIHANILLSLMKKEDMTTDLIIRKKKYKTILKERIISKNQQMLRIDYDPGTSPLKTGTRIISALKKIKPDAVIIEDYNKGLLNISAMRNILKWCRERDIMTVADPHPSRSYQFYKDTYAITPNLNEAQHLLHTGKREVPLEKIAEKLNTGCRNTVTLITLGPKGMLLYDKNFHFIPTRAKEVYDVTGAGDTVVSIFTLALVSGLTPIESAQLANYAASYVVTQIGAAACTHEILDGILKNDS